MLVFGGAAPRGPLPPRAAAAPQRKAAQIFLTPDELARFNGADKSLPVYVAIRGTIFDVSPRRDMYGTVGQGYNCLAGRDASRALGLFSCALLSLRL
jgi:predicted heme/steroid binding protein